VGGLRRRRRRQPPSACRYGVLRILALAAILALLPAPGLAQRALRYSGKVERVDLGDGRVVVEELAEKGQRRRHEVYVDRDTPIVSAVRLRAWEMRGRGAYDEVPVTLADLLAGDFVVVESTEEGDRPVARRITIVESVRRPRP
jgi:hypothetical protein